jgi:hypothetical protein
VAAQDAERRLAVERAVRVAEQREQLDDLRELAALALPPGTLVSTPYGTGVVTSYLMLECQYEVRLCWEGVGAAPARPAGRPAGGVGGGAGAAVSNGDAHAGENDGGAAAEGGYFSGVKVWAGSLLESVQGEETLVQSWSADGRKALDLGAVMVYLGSAEVSEKSALPVESERAVAPSDTELSVDVMEECYAPRSHPYYDDVTPVVTPVSQQQNDEGEKKEETVVAAAASVEGQGGVTDGGNVATEGQADDERQPAESEATRNEGLEDGQDATKASAARSVSLWDSVSAAATAAAAATFVVIGDSQAAGLKPGERDGANAAEEEPTVEQLVQDGPSHTSIATLLDDDDGDTDNSGEPQQQDQATEATEEVTDEATEEATEEAKGKEDQGGEKDEEDGGSATPKPDTGASLGSWLGSWLTEAGSESSPVSPSVADSGVPHSDETAASTDADAVESAAADATSSADSVAEAVRAEAAEEASAEQLAFMMRAREQAESMRLQDEADAVEAEEEAAQEAAQLAALQVEKIAAVEQVPRAAEDVAAKEAGENAAAEQAAHQAILAANAAAEEVSAQTATRVVEAAAAAAGVVKEAEVDFDIKDAAEKAIPEHVTAKTQEAAAPAAEVTDTTQEEARAEATRLRAEAQEEIERMRADAKAEAEQLREQAAADAARVQLAAEETVAAQLSAAEAQKQAEEARTAAEQAAAELRAGAEQTAVQMQEEAAAIAADAAATTQEEVQAEATRLRAEAQEEIERMRADAKAEAEQLREQAAADAARVRLAAEETAAAQLKDAEGRKRSVVMSSVLHQQAAEKQAEEAKAAAEQAAAAAEQAAAELRAAAEQEVLQRQEAASEAATAAQEEARAEATRLRAEAQEEIERMRADAKAEAEQLREQAAAEAARVLREQADVDEAAHKQTEDARVTAEQAATELRAAVDEQSAEKVQVEAARLRAEAQEEVKRMHAEAKTAADQLREEASTQAATKSAAGEEDFRRYSTLMEARLQAMEAREAEGKQLLALAQEEAARIRETASTEASLQTAKLQEDLHKARTESETRLKAMETGTARVLAEAKQVAKRQSQTTAKLRRSSGIPSGSDTDSSSGSSESSSESDSHQTLPVMQGRKMSRLSSYSGPVPSAAATSVESLQKAEAGRIKDKGAEATFSSFRRVSEMLFSSSPVEASEPDSTATDTGRGIDAAEAAGVAPEYSEETTIVEEGQSLGIVIKTEDGRELEFNVQSETYMHIIFSLYARREGLVVSSLQFWFNDRLLTILDTPSTIGLGNDGVILVKQLSLAEGVVASPIRRRTASRAPSFTETATAVAMDVVGVATGTPNRKRSSASDRTLASKQLHIHIEILRAFDICDMQAMAKQVGEYCLVLNLLSSSRNYACCCRTRLYPFLYAETSSKHYLRFLVELHRCGHPLRTMCFICSHWMTRGWKPVKASCFRYGIKMPLLMTSLVSFDWTCTIWLYSRS